MKQGLAVVLAPILAALLATGPLDPALGKASNRPPPAPAAARTILHQRLAENQWLVGMSGTDAGAPGLVEQAVMQAAAKITLANGYDWFEPIGDGPAAAGRAMLVAGSGRTAMRLHWGRSCSDQWSFGSGPEGLCARPGVTPTGRFQATTRLILGHGLAPQNRVAIDAHGIAQPQDAAQRAKTGWWPFRRS